MGLRLGIDLDGVVADFNAGWMRRYNDEHQAALTSDMVTGWDGLHELTHFEDMDAFWRWAENEDLASIFRHLDPYPTAIDTIRRLNKAGNDIVIITAKPEWAIHDTFEWLADHRIPTREVHVTHDKWSVACDVYLDDSPHVVPALVKHRGEQATICRFVRAWNTPVEGATDVTSWGDFEAVVNGLVNQSGASQ